MSGFISQQDAAERLGVSKKTIRSYIAEGRLAGFRVAGQRMIRVRVDDVDALLQPIPTTAPPAS